MQQQIKIAFPVLDKSKFPPTHFTDLHITADYFSGRNGTIHDLKIRKITHYHQGEYIGSNIDGLIKIIAPELFKEIESAVISHATGLEIEKK